MKALLLVALIGCAVDDEALDSLDETEAAISATNQTWPLWWHGGTGGSGPFGFGCGNGEVITGIFGRSGEYVDSIGFRCAWVNANGTIGGSYTKGPFGGFGGANAYAASCPVGEAVVGFHGRSHTYLDRIGIICAWPPFTLYPHYVDGGGGYGGDYFVDGCPHSYAVTSVSLRWGNWIDGFTAQCTYFQP
jgi:hypothetical protein